MFSGVTTLLFLRIPSVLAKCFASTPDLPEELHTGRILAWLVGLAARMRPVHNSPDKSLPGAASGCRCWD